MTLEVGDRVRVRRGAEHVLPSFRSGSAVVLDVKRMGAPPRPWLHLEFETGRRTWLPTERLEPVR